MITLLRSRKRKETATDITVQISKVGADATSLKSAGQRTLQTVETSGNVLNISK